MTDSYQEKRDKVIYGDLDVFKARQTAYDWHGGQGSAMYYFASTHASIWGAEHRSQLFWEIARCLSSVAVSDEDKGDLADLQAVIDALPTKGPEDQDP